MNNTVAFVVLLFGQISAPALPTEEMNLPPTSEVSTDVSADVQTNIQADIPAVVPENVPADNQTDVQVTAQADVQAETIPAVEEPSLDNPVEPVPTELPADQSLSMDTAPSENSDVLATPLSPAPEAKESKPEPKLHPNERMIPPPILPKPKTDAVNNSDPMLDPTLLGIGSTPQTETSQSTVQNSGSNENVLTSNDPALQPVNAIPSYSSVEDEEMFGVQLAPNQARGHIMPIYQAEVPAQEQGVLLKFYIREGAIVKKDAPLVQIDDEQAKMSVQVQQAKLNAAQKEAANEVNVKYAKAARDVAEAEVQSAEETIARVPGAVPASEIRKLKLSLIQATYQIEQAKNNLEIAGYQVEVSKAELNAAKLGITKRVVRAPIPGVVVEKYRYEGEWVKPGDSIVKIVYMDKLRVKTTMDINTMPPQKVMNHSAKITITQPGAPEFTGKVIFASPIVQSGGAYEVWIDVENTVGSEGFWVLQPGMNATVTIE